MQTWIRPGSILGCLRYMPPTENIWNHLFHVLRNTWKSWWNLQQKVQMIDLCYEYSPFDIPYPVITEMIYRNAILICPNAILIRPFWNKCHMLYGACSHPSVHLYACILKIWKSLYDIFWIIAVQIHIISHKCTPLKCINNISWTSQWPKFKIFLIMPSTKLHILSEQNNCQSSK